MNPLNQHDIGMILKRDKKQCQLCKNKYPLLVHHIDGNSSNHRPTNLITLCRECHVTTKKDSPNHIKVKKQLIRKILGIL